MLTGHITESLVTIVSGGVWAKLPEADKKIVSEVMWEASTRATNDIAEGDQLEFFEVKEVARTLS